MMVQGGSAEIMEGMVELDAMEAQQPEAAPQQGQGAPAGRQAKAGAMTRQPNTAALTGEQKPEQQKKV